MDRIAALMAVLRQWTTEAQFGAGAIIGALLDTGVGFDHVDPTSGLGLLHFAVRSGAVGVGDDASAAQLVADLLGRGANPAARCKYAFMLPVHYAATFGCAKVIDELARVQCDMDGLAPRFDGGCALHLAATAQSADAVRALLAGGANPFIKNNRGKTPHDEADSVLQANTDPNAPEDLLYDEIEQQTIVDLLRVAMDGSVPDDFAEPDGLLAEMDGLWADPSGRLFDGKKFEIHSDGNIEVLADDEDGGDAVAGKIEHLHGNLVTIKKGAVPQGTFAYYPAPDEKMVEDSSIQDRTLVTLYRVRYADPGSSLSALVPTSPTVHQPEEDDDISVGDRVLVNNKKIGTVRYKGETHFKPGVTLYGIQLVNPEGKHEGTIGMKTYFRCKTNHGTFSERKRLKLLPPEKFQEIKLTRTPARGKYDKFSPTGSGKHLSPAPFSAPTISKGSGFSLHAGLAGGPEQYERRAAKMKSPNTGRQSRSPRRTPGASTPDAERSPPAPRPRPVIGVKSDLAEGFGVGSRVMYKREVGVAKYIGGVQGKDGTFIGVEFSSNNADALGLHDGTVDGQRYFKTSNNRATAVMAPAAKVTWRGHKTSELI